MASVIFTSFNSATSAWNSGSWHTITSRRPISLLRNWISAAAFWNEPGPVVVAGFLPHIFRVAPWLFSAAARSSISTAFCFSKSFTRFCSCSHLRFKTATFRFPPSARSALMAAPRAPSLTRRAPDCALGAVGAADTSSLPASSSSASSKSPRSSKSSSKSWSEPTLSLLAPPPSEVTPLLFLPTLRSVDWSVATRQLPFDRLKEHRFEVTESLTYSAKLM
mmetsp:Transcript_53223/g.130438  ORF Transcript_53223/g.130438 Transcript_53223/m.130438 type:complete len:221 (-) Transcript_53223:505-1167(-)